LTTPRAVPWQAGVMETLFLGAIAAILAVYLLVAMLYPEKF